ncbi:ORMDL-domain-containing protein [Stemphylium lycopersici]|uniref:ORMDL-domain-containing protein n=1 Tax=Stemphylium lycopersici TaxID=183478 RepID=A0A364N124_STELY|nr:ORMDL-domain-containing protein [Stemphylium lycopersici]RAR08957.1 ORMDL-domain-containing protein [Stemphylium lycopersici]
MSLDAAKDARRRRSSSLVYKEPPESLEQLSDQSALPNLNAEWVNAKGAWAIHFVLIFFGKILFDIIPGMSQEASWTLVNLSYVAGSYLMFHYVRGVPFDFNSGAYDNLNMWEQIDNGDQYTPAKKFLLTVPIVLFLVSTHYTNYDLTYFLINCFATIAVVIPKLPSSFASTGYFIMLWSQLEPTGPHVTYLALTFFLIIYALFSLMIRNRLHLSEPPLATLFGIIVGPRALGFLKPNEWGFSDDVIQETTRLIVGIQCFAVGLELEDRYLSKKKYALLALLGPVMTFGWLICGLFVCIIFETDFVTALTIAACLTPTDPVLAASVLSNSQFSTRVPKRIRNLLSAESGCNDGVSFPFLYIGLSLLLKNTAGGVLKKWFLITILYQCVVGVLVGIALGHIFNMLYRLSHGREWMGRASYLTFYLLLAVFSIGVASVLGVDDFLVAFFAGRGFSHRQRSPLADTALPIIIDMMINSAFFVFFGAMIPWESFDALDAITPGRLLGLLVLILLFRRIPIVFAMYKMKLLPFVKTTTEAIFVGHFGPMGVGALFLAVEARAQLETGTSLPMPSPPDDLPARRQRTVTLIWPIVCFVVLGSTMVHGFSTLAVSIGGHFARKEAERAPLIGAESDGLHGMIHDEEETSEIEDE